MTKKPETHPSDPAIADKGLDRQEYELAEAIIGIRRDAVALRALLMAQYYEVHGIELSPTQDATLSTADRIAERSQQFLKGRFPDSVLDFANF